MARQRPGGHPDSCRERKDEVSVKGSSQSLQQLVRHYTWCSVVYKPWRTRAGGLNTQPQAASRIWTSNGTTWLGLRSPVFWTLIVPSSLSPQPRMPPWVSEKRQPQGWLTSRSTIRFGDRLQRKLGNVHCAVGCLFPLGVTGITEGCSLNLCLLSCVCVCVHAHAPV